ncbi:hypothetical protein ILUMI_09360 [Ignelater luminosus]|uniref:PiggyBac transposable element-derived protein domain-containing protein n=1 Tax=Ignelater luminosus TaxID=2038154 RepID=A0A8K0D9C4_IGNLU|nr:hypothetical protein ILUMI_09360 [Ignelater luminosus]
MSEIKAFLGVLILSGYVGVSRRRLHCETERDMVIEAISRDKFEYILSNFHLADNNLNQFDKFAKVRPMLGYLNEKFRDKALYEKNHSVDETMVPYFGRHGCKQYIHGKAIRYGYKLWMGATKLGYINWFEPYQGFSTITNPSFSEFGVGAVVVLEYASKLQEKRTDKKFHLFFENLFTSISLTEKLDEKGYSATGTVRKNRLPGNNLLDSKALKKEKRGTFDVSKIVDQNVSVLKWNDNKQSSELPIRREDGGYAEEVKTRVSTSSVFNSY